MFLDQARPIPISFLIPPEYHSQAGSTRLGEIQIDRGGCLIYPLLFRLHWVLFHSPVIGKHVRGRHTRRWSQLVNACKVEKSQTKYKKGDVWWHKEEQFQWLNTGRNHLFVLEQYSCRRLSELCGQILLQEKRYINEQRLFVAVGVIGIIDRFLQTVYLWYISLEAWSEDFISLQTPDPSARVSWPTDSDYWEQPYVTLSA